MGASPMAGVICSARLDARWTEAVRGSGRRLDLAAVGVHRQGGEDHQDARRPQQG